MATTKTGLRSNSWWQQSSITTSLTFLRSIRTFHSPLYPTTNMSMYVFFGAEGGGGGSGGVNGRNGGGVSCWNSGRVSDFNGGGVSDWNGGVAVSDFNGGGWNGGGRGWWNGDGGSRNADVGGGDGCNDGSNGRGGCACRGNSGTEALVPSHRRQRCENCGWNGHVAISCHKTAAKGAATRLPLLPGKLKLQQQ